MMLVLWQSLFQDRGQTQQRYYFDLKDLCLLKLQRRGNGFLSSGKTASSSIRSGLFTVGLAALVEIRQNWITVHVDMSDKFPKALYGGIGSVRLF